MPAPVLDEPVVRAQVRHERLSAPGTARQKIRGDALVLLLLDHHLDHVPVVVGLLVAGTRTLEEAVVSLRIEEPGLVYAGALELMVHIRREREVVAPLKERHKVLIGLAHGTRVAVHPNHAAPPGPVGLLIREGIEATCIHVLYSEAGLEVGKSALEALSVVGKACRHGKPGTCSHEHGVSPTNRFCYALRLIREASGRFCHPLA